MLAATFFFFLSVKHQKADVAVISNDLNRSVTDLLKAGLKAQQISCRPPTTAVSLWNSSSSWYHATVHLSRPHYPLSLDLVDSLSCSEPPSQRSHCQQPPFENWHSEDWKHPRAWLKAPLTHVWWRFHQWAVAGWQRWASHARLLREGASRRRACHNHHQPSRRIRYVKLIPGSLGHKYSR